MKKCEIAILTGVITAAIAGMILVESEKLIPFWPALIFAAGIALALTGNRFYKLQGGGEQG